MEKRASASRRIANVLLSVVLVLGLMPAPAFAGDGANDGPSALSEGGASLTPGWIQSGTCEWKIDGAGKLIVRPLDDGKSGTLRDWAADRASVPWDFKSASIRSVTIEPGVAAKTCINMFSDCANLVSADLSGLDTSQVMNMGSMFSGCKALSSLDLSGFDTSKVRGMGSMFKGCSSLTTLDLSGFDTSKATYMGSMFSGCKALSSLDLSGFDTSQVKNMGSMFSWCSSLTTLDLASFDTSQVTNMDSMFYNCSSLKKIYVLKSFTAAEVESPNNTFYQCTSLVGGAGTAYDPAIINASRAHIDGGANAPGYFTGKHEKLDGDVNGNGILNVVDAQIVYDIATTDLYKDSQDYDDMRTRADVTWDDEVDAADAFAIQYAALRGWRN